MQQLGVGGAPANGKVKVVRYATATVPSISTRQLEISIVDFFKCNTVLPRFDNRRWTLLIGVNEEVDDSLEAYQEAGILPGVEVVLEQLDDDRYFMRVVENGPGIGKGQVPDMFGKLLYSSKFHRLPM